MLLEQCFYAGIAATGCAARSVFLRTGVKLVAATLHSMREAHTTEWMRYLPY